MKETNILTILILLFCLKQANATFHLRQTNQNDSNTSDCNLITTCYECNSPLSKCQWIDSECKEKKSNSDYWFNNLLQCKDDVSLKKSHEYCHIENNDSVHSNEFWLKKINTTFDYFSGGLFCIFSIKINSKVIQLNSSNIKVGLLGLKTIDKYDTEHYYNSIPIEGSDRELKDIKKLFFYYYGNANTKETPFTIEIEKIKVDWSLSPIVITQITLGAILFIIIMVVLVFLFVSFYKRRWRERGGQGQGQTQGQQTVRANNGSQTMKTSLDQIPPITLGSVVYDGETIKLYNERCPICLDKILKQNEIIKLNCNHGFHEKCLREWMEKNIQPNVFCPLCHLKISSNERERTEENLISPHS